MSDKPMDLTPYFGRPVAVQFRNPILVADNNGETIETPQGSWGVPQPQADQGNTGAVTYVLAGALKSAKDVCEGWYFLECMTPLKAKVRYLINPANVATVIDVPQPGAVPTGLVTPGVN